MKKEQIKITISSREVDKYNDLYFKQHPRAKKKPIEKPQHPSLNWYLTANNLQVNNTKQHWKEIMLMILKDSNLVNMGIKRCSILYKTYYPTVRAHDLDNITPKFILDGLVAGNFIIDDNDRVISALTIETGYDKNNPRIELLFYLD